MEVIVNEDQNASTSNCEQINTNSEEKTFMSSISDRITNFLKYYTNINNKDLDTLLIELFEIYEELNNRKTIVEGLIREEKINAAAGETVIRDILHEISNIDNTIADIYSRRDDFIDNTIQLSNTIEELRNKVADFINTVETLIAENVSVNRSEEFPLKKRAWISFKLIITIVLSVLDATTDVWLMLQYYLIGQKLYGTLSLVFVWLPGNINTFVLYCICIKHKYGWLNKLKENKLLIIFRFVPITTALVALNTLILLLKNKINKQDTKQKTFHVLYLQFIDGYMEALPQLLLQLSVILHNLVNETQDTSFLNILRWVSMALSLLNVARASYSVTRLSTDKNDVKEAVTLFISTLLLIVLRILVLSIGFAVSPAVAGSCMLLYWVFAAVLLYCKTKDKDEEKNEKIISIIFGLIIAPFILFFEVHLLYNPVIYCKLSLRMFTYVLHVLLFVVFTTLWCMLYSSGTIWYYVVPGLAVLLCILYIPVALLHKHFVNKREADEHRVHEISANISETELGNNNTFASIIEIHI